ncbi:MAG: hypothetical protein QOF62_1101 [Pyrinomonadaceae bacterium]|jgi:hypothetical protein|nr:hypothetical protein [Pyrinomonadaceae bacterium]
MKKIFLTITLACVLSGTAIAGEMPTVEPAPSQSSTMAGEMPGVDSAAPAPSSGTQSSVVVTVLLTIISIVAR